jgi:hydrogenase/urease accessory protein HupE
MSAPITDPRLRAFFALLIPSFVGHAIQLTAEDTPWAEVAIRRAVITPGIHLHLPLEAPLVVAALLAVAIALFAASPTR